jgi:hypothetical protein
MCTTGPSNPTTKTITITISATTAVPWPLTISDGTSVGSTDGGDQNLVTRVNPGDTVVFKTAGDITAINAIQVKNGSPDLFSTDPTSSNGWTGIIGAKNTNVESYNIQYTVGGTVYTQDPKIAINQ